MLELIKVGSSETSVIGYQNRQYHIPKDGSRYSNKYSGLIKDRISKTRSVVINQSYFELK